MTIGSNFLNRLIITLIISVERASYRVRSIMVLPEVREAWPLCGIIVLGE